MISCEVCLEDIDGVALARAAGAARVELCADLLEGGTTPSVGTVLAALDRAGGMGVHVMIRARGGEFVYTEAELEAMEGDIRALRALPMPAGASLGFVFGVLHPDGTVDVDATRRLVEAAGEHHTTFHKAFDTAPDLVAALEDLVAAGVGRVLTSGGRSTLAEGERMLAGLVEQAAGRITIMAGGPVELDALGGILARTGVRDVHFGAAEPCPSLSEPLASEVSYDSGSRPVTTARRIAAFMEAARVEPPS